MNLRDKILNHRNVRTFDDFCLSTVAYEIREPLEVVQNEIGEMMRIGRVKNAGGKAYRLIRPSSLLLRKRWDKHLRIEVFA